MFYEQLKNLIEEQQPEIIRQVIEEIFVNQKMPFYTKIGSEALTKTTYQILKAIINHLSGHTSEEWSTFVTVLCQMQLAQGATSNTIMSFFEILFAKLNLLLVVNLPTESNWQIREKYKRRLQGFLTLTNIIVINTSVRKTLTTRTAEREKGINDDPGTNKISTNFF